MNKITNDKTLINQLLLVNGKWKFFCAALALAVYAGNSQAVYHNSQIPQTGYYNGNSAKSAEENKWVEYEDFEAGGEYLIVNNKDLGLIKNQDYFSGLKGLGIRNLTNIRSSFPELPQDLEIFKLRDTKISPQICALMMYTRKFSKCPNLTELDFSYNDFEKKLQRDMIDAIDSLKTIKKLKLSHNELTTIDGQISVLRDITGLDLSHNKLANIDEGITFLSSLEELDLSYNELIVLPETVGGATWFNNLTRLDVSHNKLLIFPEGNLKFLKELDISHNQLTEFPQNISSWKSLRKLNICVNEFQSLPKELWELPNLEEITIDSHLLSSVPKDRIASVDKVKIAGGIQKTNDIKEFVVIAKNRGKMNDEGMSHILNNVCTVKLNKKG